MPTSRPTLFLSVHNINDIRVKGSSACVACAALGGLMRIRVANCENNKMNLVCGQLNLLFAAYCNLN